MDNDVANGCGLAIGVVILASAAIAFTTWIAMLIAGAIAGMHGWHSPGFGETLLWLWLVAIVGSVFNTGLLGVKSK
jgi:hypothetical protein